MNKTILILDKILSAILFIISIAVIGLYLNTYYFNPGYKGISNKDLSQICIIFCFLYLVKYLLQIFSSRKQ